MVVGKRFILSLLAMVTFAGASAWYLLQPEPTAIEGKQDAASAPKRVGTETTPETPVVTAPRAPEEDPPFRVTLPRPLSDADILRSIASFHRNGVGDPAALTIAKAMLEDPAAKATAEWMAAQAGGPLRFEWFAAFQARYPDWPMTPMLRRRAETALLTSPVSDTVKSQFFAMNPPLSVAGKLAFARLLLSDGDSGKAAEIVRPLWREEQMSKNAEQQIMAAYGAALTSGDHRSRMALLLSKQNWDAALRAADAAGSNATLIAKARMAVVQNGKKADAALSAIPKAQQSDPLVAYSQLLFLTQQKKYKEAAAIIAGLVPVSTPAAPAERKETEDNAQSAPPPANGKSVRQPVLVSPIECQDWKVQQRRIIRELLDVDDAATAYQAARARLSDVGCIHDDAQFLAGWIALRFLKQPEKAKAHFDDLSAHATTASTKSRGAYWRGRVAEQESGQDAAKPYYARAAGEWSTFYGQLAREKLSEKPLPVWKTIDVPPGVRANFDNLTPVRAIRLLHEGEADDLVLPLFSELASQLPDGAFLEALASLATDQRNPRALLTVAKTGVRRGFPLETRIYPTFGIPDFSYAGKEIEVSLLYAIAHQESAFNPQAKSRAGALGLLQLMPETARTTATRFGVDFNLERLTTDPAYNARIGAAHLDDLLQNWRGSLILTFAAYNAGGGNVRKWITAHGDPRSPDVDPIDWIERIPFFETRHYVQRISENLMIYRALMKTSGPSIFAVGTYPAIPAAGPTRSP